MSAFSVPKVILPLLPLHSHWGRKEVFYKIVSGKHEIGDKNKAWQMN